MYRKTQESGLSEILPLWQAPGHPGPVSWALSSWVPWGAPLGDGGSGCGCSCNVLCWLVLQATFFFHKGKQKNWGYRQLFSEVKHPLWWGIFRPHHRQLKLGTVFLQRKAVSLRIYNTHTSEARRLPLWLLPWGQSVPLWFIRTQQCVLGVPDFSSPARQGEESLSSPPIWIFLPELENVTAVKYFLPPSFPEPSYRQWWRLASHGKGDIKYARAPLRRRKDFPTPILMSQSISNVLPLFTDV